MDDFSLFMDSVAVPSHPFSPSYQPVPPLFFFEETDFSITTTEEIGNASAARESETPTSLAQILNPVPPAKHDSSSSFSQIGSRLLLLQHEDRISDLEDQRDLHLHISAECRQRIVDELADFSNFIDEDFILPSRHVLSRFFGGYFTSFHNHFPFVHTPTFRPDAISVELFLAMAAIGARYTREPAISTVLFRMAKAIVMESIRKRRATQAIANREAGSRRLAVRRWGQVHSPTSQESIPSSEKWQHDIEVMQTMLLMVAITTWSESGSSFDSLSVRSVLDCLIREEQLLHIGQPQSDSWQSWIRHERLKRILFVAFCFLNMHTILFDIPLTLWANEVCVDLPCSEKEWQAKNEDEWKRIRQTAGQPCRNFQEVLGSLFSSVGETQSALRTNQAMFSSLGGCVLIHALIQQIWLVRKARMPLLPGDGLLADQLATFENALKTWAMFWEQNQESSMDPLSPHGPIAFTSITLMRLAYIRLNVNLGPIRYLTSWDPNLIAQSLHASPPVQRSERLTRAALHCAHALSIPVKLGINYIAETQVRFWSNQHAICSLECALLLAKWLESITVKDPSPPLTQAEERLLAFVVQLVAETEYEVSYEELVGRRGSLNAQTVRLWARLYQSKSVWEMVDLIGASLNIYADLLEEHQNRQPLDISLAAVGSDRAIG